MALDHDSLFRVMLSYLQHIAISDLAEGSHSPAPVVVFFPSCVLCLATGDDGDIHCDARHLLERGWDC